MLPSDRAAITEAVTHLKAARAALGKQFPQMRGELTRGINWLEKHLTKYPATSPSSSPASPQQDEERQEGRDEPREDTGRYESGYRIYRNGTIREDFRSDC